MATETISASMLAARISKTLGRVVSPKQVRGRARGDSGTPLLARYGADRKAPYASHVYSAAEADRIGQVFVDAHNKRSDKAVRWSPLSARKAPSGVKSRKVAPDAAPTE